MTDSLNTANYAVRGMTCAHCVTAVTNALQSLPGATDVGVELNAGATSSVTVTSTAPLSEEQVAAALVDAGDYSLATSA